MSEYFLEDCMDAIIDYRGKTPKKTQSGIPLVTAKIVKNGRLESYNEFIAPSDYEAWMTRGIPQKGDIVLTVEAPLGEVAQLDDTKIALAQRIITLRGKPNILDNKYLLYYMQGQNFQHALDSKSSGSTVKGIKQSELRKIKLSLPPLTEQKAIAKILSSLDDKIELNNKINKNLEEQAQAIFKSWFVDFEPFGGVMPSDWKEGVLGDVAEITAGGDKPTVFSQEKTSNCPIPIFSNGINSEGLYGYTDKAKILNESVTISARGTIGFICLRTEPYVPIVRLISVIPNADFLSAKYLYLYLLTQHIAGVGTTQQQITVPMFKQQKILIPKNKIIHDFSKIIDSLYEQILASKKENQTLASLRDTLLPKLMSGELRV